MNFLNFGQDRPAMASTARTLASELYPTESRDPLIDKEDVQSYEWRSSAATDPGLWTVDVWVHQLDP